MTVKINGLNIDLVVIDPHYEENHSDSINDEIILGLVQMLDGGQYDPEAENGEFLYFSNDRLKYKYKLYKIIWLLENEKTYIGIVNAYRRSYGVS